MFITSISVTVCSRVEIAPDSIIKYTTVAFGILSSTSVTCLPSCLYCTPDCHPPSLTLCPLKHAFEYSKHFSSMCHSWWSRFFTESDPVVWLSSLSLTKTTNTVFHCYLPQVQNIDKTTFAKLKYYTEIQDVFTHFINSQRLHNVSLPQGMCLFQEGKNINSNNESLIVRF